MNALSPRPVLRTLAHRVALAREPHPPQAAPPPLARLAGEIRYAVTPGGRFLTRRWTPPAAAIPRVVLLVPGLVTHPRQMRFLARQLEAAGHVAKRWGQGINLGPRPDTISRLEARLRALSARHGERLVLLGWSLGGVYAREVAKLAPECTARVITLGSPFSGHPRANRGWRAYHLVAGHRVEEPPVAVALEEKPPVETVAMWSPRDGVVAPRCAAGRPGERDRAVALRCTHIGLVRERAAILAILRELDTP